MLLTEFAEIRKAMEDSGISEALDTLVQKHIDRGGSLAGVLQEHKAEVIDMLLEEFIEEEVAKVIQEEE